MNKNPAAPAIENTRDHVVSGFFFYLGWQGSNWYSLAINRQDVMQEYTPGAKERIVTAACNMALIGGTVLLAVRASAEMGREKDPEPEEGNGQASEKGGPQGDLSKEYDPDKDQPEN